MNTQLASVNNDQIGFSDRNHHELPTNGNHRLAILLVDDHLIQANHLRTSLMSRRRLRENRATIDIASSVQDVRRKLQQKHYCISIQDLHCRGDEDGEGVFKALIDNHVEAIGLMSAIPIGGGKLKQLKEAASIRNGSPIIKTFERPVKTDDIENWLASLPALSDDGNGRSNVPLSKTLFEYPNAIASIPAATMLVVSIVFMLLWVFANIAVIHPLYPLFGLIGGAGILIEMIVGIKYDQESNDD